MEGGRVRALHFAVDWVDQHPVTWLDGAFPAVYHADGWTLTLSETRLDAVPSTQMSEDEARSAVEPILRTWEAALEVEQRLVVTFFYLVADVEPDVPETGTAAGADFAGAVGKAFDATVEIERSAPPEPDWSWRDTDVTLSARTACLRPLRNGTRPVPDAAYWLYTHLKTWAGNDVKVAHERLNVSGQYFKRFRMWGANSSERKVASSQLYLTAQQKASLSRVLEELVRRLHLVESGLPPGARLDLADWPDA
ncbi:hypothetical protein ABZ408_40065 [Streptomyces tibetensis]|uniref:hypothetical protein n=1 Tax=Streptomyces tibetensis TaxID=2382123 RepID=UPI0034064F4E